MRVLVTGAAGFIGSELVRQIVRRGHDVTAYVRPEASLVRLADVRERLTIAYGDLLDPTATERALSAHPVDVCIHLAWFISPGVHPNSSTNVEYVGASMNLLRTLDAIGCRRTIIAGTCLEQDTRAGCLSEDSPIAPRNFYAACKHALHVMAAPFQQRQGRSFAWARLFNSYGPFEYDGALVPDVIQKLLAGLPCELTTGTQVRDFLHVEDVAGALWAIACSDRQGPFNVGSSQPVTVAAVAERIGALTGRAHLLRFGARPLEPFDAPVCFANTDRLRGETGWQPRIGLEEGLASTIAWWRQRRAKGPLESRPPIPETEPKHGTTS